MNPGFGAVVIGDEILSGRRQDRHVAAVIERLNARGLRLRWARLIGDDPALIEATLRETMQGPDAVFCFGGIGATPDDLTRECAARAAGVALTRHAEALALIEAQFGADAWPHRVLMADLPEGATLIPNPYNRVPGFALNRHFFMPGFPVMAHPMLDWVLASHFPEARDADYEEQALLIPDVTESQLLDLMREITHDFPKLRLFSLPIIGENGRRLELGVKGPAPTVQQAMARIQTTLNERGLVWED
ncbi:MAG: molybdopterin-binding protein [Halothiobacillaceae bacterium]|jgi:molybdopterin-biosynthesis enzyme MoeA-like protein|nr:molybdopterin-binding protein [Halothiobacillaceae bacterium]MDY0049779.1 molybdopterin-binding protein [Halothiobacillaceae bacterium]